MVSVSVLVLPVDIVSQQLPAGKKAAPMRIIKGPGLESATDKSAIIRWTTNTGRSVIEHSIVHYGTDPKDLSSKAESLNRWNRNLPYMIHRVQVLKLTPQTTYYFTVESVRGDGTLLGGTSSTVKHFTTEQMGRRQSTITTDESTHQPR